MHNEPENLKSELDSVTTRTPQPKTQSTANSETNGYATWCRLASRLGKRYSGTDPNFPTCTLESFVCREAKQRKAVDSIGEYLDSLDEQLAAGRNIVLFGASGTGKDHLLVGVMAKALRMRNLGVEWINGADWLGGIRDGLRGSLDEKRLTDELVTPEVLAISDPVPPLGRLTEFQAALLFRAIDRRYRQQKPVWLTLNVSNGTEAEDRLGVQTVDRLRHGALLIHCDWPSYRKSNGG